MKEYLRKKFDEKLDDILTFFEPNIEGYGIPEYKKERFK